MESLNRGNLIKIGVAAGTLLFLSWKMSWKRSKKDSLVHRAGRFYKNQTESVPLGNIDRADAILDAVERHLLPLTCTGVAYNEGLPGAIVLDSQGNFVTAATSGEKTCPLHSCEMLALEDACLVASFYNNSLDLLKDCIFVSTHRSSILDLGLPLLRKCGITRVYALFDSPPNGSDGGPPNEEVILEEDIAASRPGYTPPEGVLQRGDVKLTGGGIEIAPFFGLIGEVNTASREFDSEEHLRRQMAQDQRRLKLQKRLLTVHRIYRRLAHERSQVHGMHE